MPYVAESWSSPTGRYDLMVKIRIYKSRGDLEIWRVHPFEQTVTAWRRRPDGEYDELTFTGGKIRLHALSQVVIDLDALFA